MLKIKHMFLGGGLVYEGFTIAAVLSNSDHHQFIQTALLYLALYKLWDLSE